ncbi:hypothetical protein KIW84_071090 [Lathyrus oleraceus]|uniref:Uncharacterized protein n=1 Tax=Pisum sativum TaxID=3888 RepID=A0A9D4VHF0_PEA|nr:hypothetical protein KIW84_071090 [Pisum sativum]
MNATNPAVGNGVPVVTHAHAEGVPTNLNVTHTFHVLVHGGSQVGADDRDGDFFMPRNEYMYEPFGPSPTELERRFQMMDERVRAIEGPSTFGLEAADMCLVSGVKIPAKFKGYHSRRMAQQNMHTAEDKLDLSIPEKFVSAGHLFQGQVTMVDDDISVSEADCFVLKKTMGQTLNNWIEADIPEVSSCQT